MALRGGLGRWQGIGLQSIAQILTDSQWPKEACLRILVMIKSPIGWEEFDDRQTDRQTKIDHAHLVADTDTTCCKSKVPLHNDASRHISKLKKIHLHTQVANLVAGSHP